MRIEKYYQEVEQLRKSEAVRADKEFSQHLSEKTSQVIDQLRNIFPTTLRELVEDGLQFTLLPPNFSAVRITHGPKYVTLEPGIAPNLVSIRASNSEDFSPHGGTTREKEVVAFLFKHLNYDFADIDAVLKQHFMAGIDQGMSVREVLELMFELVETRWANISVSSFSYRNNGTVLVEKPIDDHNWQLSFSHETGDFSFTSHEQSLTCKIPEEVTLRRFVSDSENSALHFGVVTPGEAQTLIDFSLIYDKSAKTINFGVQDVPEAHDITSRL